MAVTNDTDALLSMQVIFGTVLMILGMLMLFFMQSMSIVIIYIAVALLCFKDGLTQLIAAVIQIRNLRKEG